MDELEREDLMTVVTLTRNLLDKVTLAQETLAASSVATLAYVLEGVIAGRWKPSAGDELGPLVGTLLPVLKAAYKAVPAEELGRGNVATHLHAFGAEDEDQALRIAEAAGIE